MSNDAYTDEELTEDIYWLYAGHDQGQRDDDRKDRVKRALRLNDKRAVRVLTACAKAYLESSYTIEDVANFIKFLDWYLDYSL